MTEICERNAKRVWGTNFQEYHPGKFYRICLSGASHLEYINPELCAMLGYERKEIKALFQDRYTELIHPEDVEKYRNLLNMVSSAETSVMIEYRLKTKSGEIIYVSDTMTSRKYEDGSWKAFSAVTYINDLKKPYEVMETANHLVSCGVIKFTCEAYPKVLFMNEGMRMLLGAEKGDELFLEDVRNNIYFMLPVEEKPHFRSCLKASDESKGNVSFKGSIFQTNGEKRTVTGWIQKNYTEGNEEYEGFFLDSETYATDERIVLRRDFIDALTSVYDTAFEIDLKENTIRCLHVVNPITKKAMSGVRMLLKDAVEYWCENVYPESMRKECRSFFSDIQSGLNGEFPRRLVFGLKNPFDAQNGGGTPKEQITYYKGVYFTLSDLKGIFCFSKADQEESVEDGNSLKFSLKENRVKILSMGNESQRFLGLTDSEKEIATSEGMDRNALFERCPLSGDDVLQLLEEGSMSYTIGFGDGRMETRTAEVVPAENSDEDIHKIRYNLLMAKDSASIEIQQVREPGYKRISIRTFGYFDVFVNDVPVAFKSAKAKELLAILVDRRGGYVSARDAISYLWENEPANKVTLARYRKVAMRLKNELKENNIENMIITLDGKRRINQKIVDCDLYEYLEDKQKNQDMFNGSYMLNYSWGEYMQAELQKF